MMSDREGRNWEGFGADPYMDGVLGAQSIRGLQESVIASVKHFVANVSIRCVMFLLLAIDSHIHSLGARDKPQPHCR